MRFGIIVAMFSVAACAPHANDHFVDQSGLPGLGSAHATQMTSQECTDAGGVRVGDIGDGRIHRAEYLCENGEMPLGTIIPDSDKNEPIFIEGSVCCGSSANRK